MSSIRYRTLFLAFIALAVTGTFGMLAYLSYMEHNDLLARRDISYQISTAVFANESQISDTQSTALRALIPNLYPEFRQSALTQYLEKMSNEKRRYVLKVENDYRNYLNEILTFLQKRIRYYGLICLSTTFLLIGALLYFVFAKIFDPLKDLSNKMVDFLNNRYSYQFSVPAPNEIGRLHATFNAMAQRVLSQLEDLRSLDKAKSEFLSIASHELRTPLTSIKGSLSLLNSGVVGQFNEGALNLMNIALNETDRLIRLINELLDLAKIEAKRFPLNLSWHSANSIVTTTLDGLQGFAKTARVHLELVDDGVTYDINADQDRIQQVLTNFLSNAIKYSPVDGTVKVVISVAEQHLKFEVVDQGKGIAPEDQELIFEKFRQATSPENPLVKGTGLGLAIAKALIEQHGGGIGVRSAPGQGSTFYFTLPQWRLAQDARALAS
jgi:signal transduction histidine kinase